MSNLASRLKFLREKKGYTQEELSKKLGLTRQSISNYEKNKRTPDFETLEVIADFFNVDLDYLYGRTNIQNKEKWLKRCDNVINISDLQYDIFKIEKGIIIPVLGEVAAGQPIFIEENYNSTEEISENLASTGNFFGLKIHGDSMSPRIKEGDIVIVRKQDYADSGDIVIVLINGDSATCKKLMKHDNGITLISFNSSYEPIYFSNQDIIDKPISILGKVVENRQKY
jgi:lexA repressor